MVFGLTGGIASGKSAVTQILREAGVSMVDADQVARQVVEPGTEGLRWLVEAFGEVILQADGSLDRPKLGALVFADKTKREALDRILGQNILDVIDHQVRWLSRDHDLVGVDAPLLIEKGLHWKFRPVVVVAVSEETQLRRLMARDGFNEAEAKARLGSQLPLSEKLKVADLVIQNDGSLEDLRRQTLEVLDILRA